MITQLDLRSAKRVLSAFEVCEMMEMGLCIVCGKPFTDEHQSAHKNIRMFVIDNDEDEIEHEEVDQPLSPSSATPTTSLAPFTTDSASFFFYPLRSDDEETQKSQGDDKPVADSLSEINTEMESADTASLVFSDCTDTHCVPQRFPNDSTPFSFVSPLIGDENAQKSLIEDRIAADPASNVLMVLDRPDQATTAFGDRSDTHGAPSVCSKMLADTPSDTKPYFRYSAQPPLSFVASFDLLRDDVVSTAAVSVMLIGPFDPGPPYLLCDTLNPMKTPSPEPPDGVADCVTELLVEHKHMDPTPILESDHSADPPPCCEIHRLFGCCVGNLDPLSIGCRDAANSFSVAVPLLDISPYDPGPLDSPLPAKVHLNLDFPNFQFSINSGDDNTVAPASSTLVAGNMVFSSLVNIGPYGGGTLLAFDFEPNDWCVNVQPYSCSSANFVVFTGLLHPGNRIMGLDSPSGGHLSHGCYTLGGKKVAVASIFFKQIAPIVILHRELVKTKESNGLIITLVSASNVVVDFGEQVLSVTIDNSEQDAYHGQPRLFESGFDVGTGLGLSEANKAGDEYLASIVDCKEPKSCTVLLRDDYVAVLHKKIIHMGNVQATKIREREKYVTDRSALMRAEFFKFSGVGSIPIEGSKESLLLFQLVKLIAVVHRKMINRGSALVTKIMLKWRDLPPKHDTWKFAAAINVFMVIQAMVLVQQFVNHQSFPKIGLGLLYALLTIVSPTPNNAMGALVDDNLFAEQLNSFHSGSGGENDKSYDIHLPRRFWIMEELLPAPILSNSVLADVQNYMKAINFYCLEVLWIGVENVVTKSVSVEFGLTKVIVSVIVSRERKKALLHNVTGCLYCYFSNTKLSTQAYGQVSDYTQFIAIRLQSLFKPIGDVSECLLLASESTSKLLISFVHLALTAAGIMSLLIPQHVEMGVVFHRKMIERGRTHVPPVLLKWKTLPLKHGTKIISSLRTRMLEGEGIVTVLITVTLPNLVKLNNP